MKDISKLTEYIGKFTDNVVQNVAKAQRETAEKVWGDIVQDAPTDGGDYVSSIQLGDTTLEGDTISTEIFTDDVVTTKDGKVYNLGFLLETGTDPHAIPNAFGWGDKYGYDSEKYKRTLDPNWHPGTEAQPHFVTNLMKNKQLYKENIKKAVKEAKNG